MLIDVRRLLPSSRIFTAIIAVSLCAIIGYVDYRTGHEISLSAFYLLPISLVALMFGRLVGIWAAIACAVLETIANTLSGGIYYSHILIHAWNMLVLMAIYIYIAVLVSSLSDAYAEEKKRSVELCRVNNELQTAYNDMESFSYSVSHDLRAPLRIIDGMIELLFRDHSDKLDDNGGRLLNVIQGHAKRMDQLVLGLLALSKAGRQDMRIDEIDMERMVEPIVEDLKALAPGRNIEVSIKKLPPAHGDVRLIRQVLTNLLSNAVKFTKDKDMTSIEIGGRSEDGEDVYYVRDNGAGFDMNYADRLFGVFQRLHSAREFEGIGIGLSIVHRIVRRHGGRVWAEGRPSEGATFYFALPRNTG
jgi:two-component system sensor kinase